MWLSICKFEIDYKLRRPETYVYFVFLLVVSIFAFDFIYYGKEMGPLQSSSPQVIGTTMAILSGFFMIITSMVMGVSIIKDYECEMESLLFVSPIRKWEYLLGRYMGSFAILLVVFSAILFGMMFGDWMPWREVGLIQEHYLVNYLHSFAVIVFPALFFGGSIFFVSGMLSRKMIVVYTQGLVFFLVLLISMKIENPFISGVLDPFSHVAIGQVMSTISLEDAADQRIPVSGVLLCNRLVWCGLGLVVLIYGYFRFTLGVAVISDKRRLQIVKEPSILSPKLSVLGSVNTSTSGLMTAAHQLRAHSLFYFYSILRKPTFWAIIICGIVSIVVNSISLRASYGVDSFPVTYLILDELKEMSIFFFLIMLGLFTSDVIWCERRSRIDQVVDALPISDLVMVGGKFIGIILTYVVLLLCMLLFGVIFQASSGFYDYQFNTYLLGFAELWLFLVLYTFLSFFFQIVTNSQFIGHILLVVFFVVTGLLALKGFNHGLYDFGGRGLSEYSELNRFGHSIYPFVLFKAYWIACCVSILALAAVLNLRGKDVSLKARIKALKYRMTPTVIGVVGLSLFSMLLLGAFIFYNTNVINQYHSTSSKATIRSEYEKTLKHLEYFPQPKITKVSLVLDLFPEDRSFELEGIYLLTNMDSVNIDAIHIQTFQDGVDATSHVTFDRSAKLSDAYELFGFNIYKLDQALAPGDTIQMNFRQVETSKGFSANQSTSQVIYNGTFINNDKFPSIGYCSKIELSDRATREEYDLAPVPNKADRDHPFETFYSRDGGDGSSIDFDLVVSTDIGQIAVAPGALLREWTEAGRSYFHYHASQPIVNFYAVTSARYEVLRSQWSPSPVTDNSTIDLEIYYHPAHAYNVERMMNGLSASLAYCSSAFGPYPYANMKIVEVPRDFDRAQSFPTMIAYSESMGFIMDVDSTVDLNVPFFITAHEVAHQWWGMQLVAANVKGKHLLLESLSHYTALMTYQETYGKMEANRLVEFEVQRYKAGNREDLSPEVALIDVTDQEYLYYCKASILLYRLQEQMGEDQLNDALGTFICDWNATTRVQEGKRFAISTDLLPYIRANAPDNLQNFITSVFAEVGSL